MFWIVTFLASLTFLAYILFGYPLLLRTLARHFGKPVKKAETRKTVSFVVAVYNGERFLARKLRSILALNYPKDLLEIMIVSDGSTDDTEEVARAFAAEGVKLVRIPRSGKAAALNCGIEQTKGELIAFSDVRQELHPDCLRLLVNNFADESVGVASGTLIIRNGGPHENEVGLYWRYETWIRSQLGHLDSMFGATGSCYAMRRKLAAKMPIDTLLDDVFLPMGAFFKGYRLVVEEGAEAYDYPTTLETEFNRKVRTLAGNYQLIQRCPWLLGPRNRMWFHFLSYKAGRLLLPHALFLLLLSSFFLPHTWFLAAAISQIVFYALAAIDPYVPSRSWLKRITCPPRTFVVLVLAAARAMVVFFVPPHTLWKETKVAYTKP